MKQKATKLDVGAPKLSRQRRAPTRTEEFFGRQSAPDYDIDVISNYYRTSFETLEYDWVIKTRKCLFFCL